MSSVVDAVGLQASPLSTAPLLAASVARCCCAPLPDWGVSGCAEFSLLPICIWGKDCAQMRGCHCAGYRGHLLRLQIHR